ncbi:MAG: nitroreductase/quinone reductase family protein [Pseudomonadota bacterium]
MDWKTLNAQVIAEFRANQGKVAQFGDLPVVILHTIGAKTGRLLEVPLIVVLEDDGTMLLFGTNAGSKSPPVWAFNLRANPEITIEYSTETFRANMIELSGKDREERISIQSERTPIFAEYVASAAPRQVPVFTIQRLG